MGMSGMATGMGSFGMIGAAMMPGMPTSEYPIAFSKRQCLIELLKLLP